MVDAKTIEVMYTSLWRGYKDYKFSQLRSALKEYDVPDLDNLKLNLKSDREALLKIAEKFLMDALNSVESDYPDIPLTYGWQFEGVDDSKDCFLYPTTPLACDVLNGQCCELPAKSISKSTVSDKSCAQTRAEQGQEVAGSSFPPANEAVNHCKKVFIQSNKSKSTVSNKGFGQIKSIQVKAAVIPLPYIGDVVAYCPDNKDAKWLDLDDLTEQLEVAFSPELEKVKVYQVKPMNGKYKSQARRAIRIQDSIKIVDLASNLGNKKARKLYNDMVGHGMQEVGIKGAVMIDGVVIPHDEDGNLLKQYAIDTGEHALLIDNWLLIENWQEYDKNTDTPDYGSLPMLINLMVASIANRKHSEVKRYAAIEFLEWIYPSLELDNLVRQEAFVEALGKDEELYVTLCQDMLSEVRKQAVINVFKLPECFHICDEIKSIVDAKSSKDPSIKLINNWLHPLSETKEGIVDTNGEPYCNTWQFASMCVGAATGRAPATNSQAATGMMLDLGVIDSRDSVALERAKSDDSIYLQLLGAVKEAMDSRVESAFGDK